MPRAYEKRAKDKEWPIYIKCIIVILDDALRSESYDKEFIIIVIVDLSHIRAIVKYKHFFRTLNQLNSVIVVRWNATKYYYCILGVLLLLVHWAYG